MKWLRLLLVFWLFCLLSVPFSVYAQDAPASQQWLLIQGILNDLDLSTSNLEANTAASNKIISDLSLTNNSMQATIEMQRRQLKQESENSANWERTARERSQEYGQTLQSLETSLTELSQENKEKDGKILKMTETNAAQTKAIFIMGGILGIIAAYLIIRLVLWVKGGAAVSLIKKLFVGG